MRPQTPELKNKLRQATTIEEKLALLENAYAGETCYLLTCGPSFNVYWDENLRHFLADKLVISVKQTYDVGPDIADFHLLNSWNYKPYEYDTPGPIVLMERADDDPATPDLHEDLMFRIPDPRNFERRLATTLQFEDWLFSKTPDRPWGPGVVYELGIYLMLHIGVKNIITLGWDLGELNAPTMSHFFHEEPPESNKSDGIANKPKIRPFEVGDIAESTRALYYWLRAKGIYLYVCSDRSLVDPIVPRVSIYEENLKPWRYSTAIIGNGDFSRWDNGKPSFWACIPFNDLVEPGDPDENGQSAITLHPNPDGGQASLYQKIKIDRYFEGGRLRARIEALCHEPGKFGLVIALMKNDRDRDPIIIKRDHPGDGKWRTLEIEEEIPEGIQLNQLKVSLTLRAGAASAVMFRNAEGLLEK